METELWLYFATAIAPEAEKVGIFPKHVMAMEK